MSVEAVALMAPLIGVMVQGWRAQKKLDTIHVLVNSRLTEALEKIARLEGRLQVLTGEVPTGEPPRKL